MESRFSAADHISGQQFALGQEILDREDKVVVAIPGLVRQQSRVRRWRYLSAEAYAVEIFARLPAMRFNSAMRSCSAIDVIR